MEEDRERERERERERIALDFIEMPVMSTTIGSLNLRAAPTSQAKS